LTFIDYKKYVIRPKLARNPSKTKELDWSYTPRKLTIENSSRREDGKKKNNREAKDEDA